MRHLAHTLGWPLTRDAALCIYTGLVTDTGRFQYSNTTPEVFALAEELATFDLPIAEMTRQLFEEHRFAYLQLVAKCLTRATLDTELEFVSSWITEDDLREFNVEIEETRVIDLVPGVRGEVSASSGTPEGVRVSLRSLSRFDVAASPRQFAAAAIATRGLHVAGTVRDRSRRHQGCPPLLGASPTHGARDRRHRRAGRRRQAWRVDEPRRGARCRKLFGQRRIVAGTLTRRHTAYSSSVSAG